MCDLSVVKEFPPLFNGENAGAASERLCWGALIVKGFNFMHNRHTIGTKG
jgi:hypothetical protein